MKFLEQNKKMLLNSSLFLSCGLALTACGPKAANFDILPAGQSTYQGSTANNKVDILWVIDNSGSMLTKQQNLAAGFNSFSSVFVNKGFDFNMAIVTSDTRTVGAGGQNGIFQGVPTVISGTTANFAAIFQANVVVGAAGDSAAKELDAIQLALSNPNLSGANAGFLRSDAHLAVIELSDADDDDSTATTANTISFLQGIKPDKYDVLTNTYKKNFTISAVGVNSLTDPDCAPLLPLIEVATKFKSLVSSTNGSFASICKADFGPGLSTISQTIAEAITEIPLARVPDTSTLSITFNGTSVPNDPTNGYTYVSSRNMIVFHGTWIPQANTNISINYVPNDIIR
ncbi:MAG: hypothetical protein ACXVCZ_19220 [Bdellovibrionota bacterium]